MQEPSQLRPQSRECPGCPTGMADILCSAAVAVLLFRCRLSPHQLRLRPGEVHQCYHSAQRSLTVLSFDSTPAGRATKWQERKRKLGLPCCSGCAVVRRVALSCRLPTLFRARVRHARCLLCPLRVYHWHCIPPKWALTPLFCAFDSVLYSGFPKLRSVHPPC